MKKITIILSFLLLILTLSACSLEARTFGADIVIGESEKFKKEEIKGVAGVVKEKFKDFKDCTLMEIQYDERKSDNVIKDYLKYKNEINPENVMVLFSKFKVGEKSEGGNFKANTVYTNWKWILVRDLETGEWTVDDWGY